MQAKVVSQQAITKTLALPPFFFTRTPPQCPSHTTTVRKNEEQIQPQHQLKREQKRKP